MSKTASVSSRKLLSALFVVSALTMQGCASSTKQSVVYQPPQPPADLSAPCSDLTPIANGESVTVATWIVDAVQRYNDCRAKHEGLLRAWPSISFTQSLK